MGKGGPILEAERETDSEKQSILIYNRDSNSITSLSHICELVPQANFSFVNNEQAYHSELGEKKFDLVVLNYQLADLYRDLVFQDLRLRDNEPGVLVVTESPDPQLIAKLYDAGCDRCIVKSGNWLDELGPAIRHLLRIRRLKEENILIRAKLTEANRLLEEKNRRLDEFSMTVAHDIRGPLGGVCMKLEYVLEHSTEGLPQRSRELISRALESSRRLTGIVQAMYEYAKLGSKAARMEPVELKQLISEVLSDMQFEEDVEVKVGIAELPTVWGNPELLRRVFYNLITNAIKYNDKDEVVINIGTRAVINKNLTSYAEVFVFDNGPGIATEELNYLFSMFSRGSSNAQGKDGLGVGLAVVKRIVELHYGSIRVDSQPSKGTTFIIRLPIEKFDF